MKDIDESLLDKENDIRVELENRCIEKSYKNNLCDPDEDDCIACELTYLIEQLAKERLKNEI